MGVALTLNKKAISLFLPNTSFNRLGWLTSLDKVIKLYNGEKINKLATILSRQEIDLTDWSRLKELFITSCNKWKND